MNKLTRLFFAATLLLGGVHSSVLAQDATNATAIRELEQYQGADRQERLLAAAKKEGELSVYHIYPNLPVMMDAFSKKYGIKIKAWRAGSEAVLLRVTNEARAGRFDVDIVQSN